MVVEGGSLPAFSCLACLAVVEDMAVASAEVGDLEEASVASEVD